QNIDITTITTQYETTDEDLRTGNEGEQFVYEYLKQEFIVEGNETEIEWKNKVKESYLRYDIEIIKRT
ncbi:unnamed protein product, partial [Didymodactylos carnosus]